MLTGLTGRGADAIGGGTLVIPIGGVADGGTAIGGGAVLVGMGATPAAGGRGAGDIEAPED